MPKIEAAIRDAILRGARRQVRQATMGLRREVHRLRPRVAQLPTDLMALRAVASHWERAVQQTPWPEVSEDELKAARVSPTLIGNLRSRLGVSQAKLGRLLGVSATAVTGWERGRSAPSEGSRRRLVGLRKLGRRDVTRLLARAPTAAAGRSRARSATSRTPRRGKRGRRT